MFSANTTQVSGGYQISRSLRFNSADSAYLNRTPAGAPTSRNNWTFSFWFKTSLQNIANIPTFLGVDTGGTDAIQIDTNYRLGIVAGGSDKLITSQVFRDPSAWYHIVVAVDTTNATSSNKLKIYVNGVEVTNFATDNRATLTNNSFKTNTAIIHNIGNNPAVDRFYGGYLTEIYMIDGQTLTPSSFGETNAQTGVWQPKAYSGSYGTNGFYLNFSDNSNTTAATLGKDYSGNGNNWTPNNFSVSAGAGNDSLVDSPTSYGTDTGVGGTVRGNYATLNPVDKKNGTLSNGNLDLKTEVDGSWNNSRATIGVSSGKFYWEMTSLNNAGDSTGASLASPKMPMPQLPGQNDVYGISYYNTGTLYYRGTQTTSWGSSWTTNDVIGVALDMDNGKVWFSKNGTWQASGDPANGTNPARSDLLTIDTTWMAISATYQNLAAQNFNFGQRPFAYTAPSGYKALCTQNLPTPAIGNSSTTQASKYFNPVLYTGNGSSSRSVTGVGFQPDFVWMKSRSNAFVHGLANVVCGVNRFLVSNNTNAEYVNDAYGYLSSFDSDGFGLTGGSTNNDTFNGNGATYVAWNWKANGSGSTNTSGTITSTVSANTTSGFSVVTCTSPASGAFTVGHGLGVAPAFVITKVRNISNNWNSYHVSLGNSASINLNQTDAVFTGSTNWNNTSPTSTVFSFGSGFAGSYPIVMYCFAEVAGYSKFGSYNGNSSSDGPFIFTGFRPAYVMIKRTDTSGFDWLVWDNARSTYNVTDKVLYPNGSYAEGSGTAVAIDFLSNGFKIRNTDTSQNASGGSYIFAAFATSPFKYSLAR